MQAQRAIKDILRNDCFIGGMSAILEDTNPGKLEMPVYILCAVGACLVVLFLSMKETVVPLIFMWGIIPHCLQLWHQYLSGADQLHHRGFGHGAPAGRDDGFLIFAAPVRGRKAFLPG